MSFYIILYGDCQIEEIFVGKTKRAVVKAARSLIDQWPEYQAMDDSEIIDMLDQDDAEFDLVEIPEEFAGDYAKEELIKIYNHYFSGIVPRPPRH